MSFLTLCMFFRKNLRSFIKTKEGKKCHFISIILPGRSNRLMKFGGNRQINYMTESARLSISRFVVDVFLHKQITLINLSL